MCQAMRTFLLIFLAAAVASASAAAQQRTGSHLDSHSARPTRVHFNVSSEIDRILNLIEAGRNQEAVSAAHEHVESLRTMQLHAETKEAELLYYALNALCIALTTTSQFDEALETCSAAIDESPQRWSAWNSRGTTYFATANFEEALADFSRAYALAPDDEAIVDTIQWNIRLTNERLAGD